MKKIRIVLLEDDTYQADAIAATIKNDLPGCQVVTIESESAFRALVKEWITDEKEVADLVVADQMLRWASVDQVMEGHLEPRPSGFRAGDRSIRLLRSQPATAEVPVILHSILPGDSTSDEHTFYVQKTAETNTLTLTIRGVLAARDIEIPDPPDDDENPPEQTFDPGGPVLLNITSISTALTAGLLLAKIGGWLDNRVGFAMLVVSTLLSTILLFVTRVFHDNPLRDVRRAAAVAAMTFLGVVAVTAGAHYLTSPDQEDDDADAWQSELETVLRANGLWDDDTTLQLFVRPLGAGADAWSTSLDVAPDEMFQAVVQYENAGTTTGQNVIVASNLAKYSAYVEGSTVISNGNHPDGLPAGTDNLTRGGIDIGDYKPGTQAYVMFDAVVDPITAFETCGQVELTLVGVVRAEGQNEFFNSADLSVEVECSEGSV